MISKLRLLFILGIVALFLPYLGIPSSWKTMLTIAVGILLIYLAIKMKREYKILKFKLRRFEQPAAPADAVTTSST